MAPASARPAGRAPWAGARSGPRGHGPGRRRGLGRRRARRWRRWRSGLGRLNRFAGLLLGQGRERRCDPGRDAGRHRRLLLRRVGRDLGRVGGHLRLVRRDPEPVGGRRGVRVVAAVRPGGQRHFSGRRHLIVDLVARQQRVGLWRRIAGNSQLFRIGGPWRVLGRSVGEPYGRLHRTWVHAVFHPVLLGQVACHEVIPRLRVRVPCGSGGLPRQHLYDAAAGRLVASGGSRTQLNPEAARHPQYGPLPLANPPGGPRHPSPGGSAPALTSSASAAASSPPPLSSAGSPLLPSSDSSFRAMATRL